jgi:hypothetical protein
MPGRRKIRQSIGAGPRPDFPKYEKVVAQEQKITR